MSKRHPERVPLYEAAAILGLPEHHLERCGWLYGLTVRDFGSSRWVYRKELYELLLRRKRNDS